MHSSLGNGLHFIRLYATVFQAQYSRDTTNLKKYRTHSTPHKNQSITMATATTATATTASKAATKPTILRVKRPRSVDSVPTLEFSGKKRARTNNVQDLADQLANVSWNNTAKPAKASLIWKRVGTSDSAPNKRSFKYVDATLNPIGDNNDASKKQRLALTLEQPGAVASPAAKSSPRKSKNAILDPISRLITENMKKVQDGSATLANYISFLEQDERVRHDPAHYLTFSLQDGTNVLHLVALWNCVEEARHVLLKYPSIAPLILNSGEQAPYQMAIMAGHDQVAAVLEAFGADTHDYVYDVFELVTDVAKESSNTVVELHGGVGYLNEHGELILEAHCPEDYEQDSEPDDNDDDVDSNAEDYEFNDYPEEEDDDDENSDADDDNVGFRHYNTNNTNAVPVYMPHEETAPVVTAPPPTAVVNDADAAEYDAQYGLYSGNDEGDDDGGGTQRFYAYDPEYDDE
jgi:hypothetical protein